MIAIKKKNKQCTQSGYIIQICLCMCAHYKKNYLNFGHLIDLFCPSSFSSISFFSALSRSILSFLNKKIFKRFMRLQQPMFSEHLSNEKYCLMIRFHLGVLSKFFDTIIEINKSCFKLYRFLYSHFMSYSFFFCSQS